MDTKWVSHTEYAERVGVTKEALMKAIENGRIPASAVSMVSTGGKNKRIVINQPEADIAWIATFNEKSAKPTDKARAAVERISAEISNTDTEKTDEPVTDKMSLREAQRLEQVAKARLKGMEVLKVKGELVSRDLVRKQLFEAGTIIRDTLMAVPDRITAEVIAASNNPTKVRTILTEAIATALEKLDDLYNKKLG